MKFAQRLGYYLGGFAIGLVVLAFFLSGKNASCDYGPNARTVKNISQKALEYSPQVKDFVTSNNIDSVTVKNLIRYGNVDFSKSNIKTDSCRLYVIENSYKDDNIRINIKNCDSIALIRTINFYY